MNRKYNVGRIIFFLFVIGFILMLIFFGIKFEQTSKCLKEIAENICKEKGREFYRLIYTSQIYEKENDFFTCINTDSRKLDSEDFLFLKEEVESCKQ